jgi:WXG100 family type VII secretion target
VRFAYTVDLDLAQDIVASLASLESGLTDVVVDLHWRLAHLRATWAGTAAAAHVEAHRSWESSYAEMHDALVAMRRVVDTAVSNYSSAGASNLSMWGSVR